MPLQQSPGIHCTPVEGSEFTDTIDGYFPLVESLRQLLDRHDFTSVLLSLSHAPFVHLEGVAHDAPVPLKLSPDVKVGQISELLLLATMKNNHLALCGVGEWWWMNGAVDDDLSLSPKYRLAEPAYVTGFGFMAGTENIGQFGHGKLATAGSEHNLVSVTSCVDADLSFPVGSNSYRLWAIEHTENAIVKRTTSNLCNGEVCFTDTILERLKPGFQYLLVGSVEK